MLCGQINVLLYLSCNFLYFVKQPLMFALIGLFAAAKKKEQFPVLLSKLYAKLRGRPLEQPQSSTSTSSSSSTSSLLSSKLLMKVVLVAAVAAGWQYYSG